MCTESRVPAPLTGFHFLLFCTDVERGNSKEGCTGMCKDHQGTAAVLKKLEWNREKVLLMIQGYVSKKSKNEDLKRRDDVEQLELSSTAGRNVIQSLSRAWLLTTPWTAAHQASLSLIISQNLLNFMSIESLMPTDHLILCHPLLLLPSTFPSIKVSSNESALHIRFEYKEWEMVKPFRKTVRRFLPKLNTAPLLDISLTRKTHVSA